MFKVGQSVTWTKSNSDVPKGTVGVITHLNKDGVKASVQFPTGSWAFPFTQLKASSKKPAFVGFSSMFYLAWYNCVIYSFLTF